MKKLTALLIVLALFVVPIHSAAALTITTEVLPEATVGEMYSAQIDTSASFAEFLLITKTGGNNNFPTWMTLSEEGEISGVPLTFGTYRFWVQATAADGSSAQKEITLVINPGSDILPLVMQTAELPEATKGVWYSTQLVASGQKPISFFVADATDTRVNQFPTELNLSIDGYISGTPLAAGDYVFSVELLNDYEVIYCEYTLTVVEPPLVSAAQPVIEQQPKSVECKTGEQVTAKVTASVSDAGELSYQWYQASTPTYSSATRLTDETDATLSFTAADAGIYYYFASVSNTLQDSKVSVQSDIIAVTVYEGETEPEPEPEPEDAAPNLLLYVIIAALAVAVIVLSVLLAKSRHTKRTDFRF